ncbi:hypothetical protein L596_012575 [Steinernema carpocapsae]|uniref:7TM GPCR serpentine receptor class x (Srx) domain-containing protein n=1 Tax=Steinernema carpocapsae TaxID=34508 RepID=A0A4U5NXP9_STECR|nr:hypothetical protein L596_012575 [Steinernema carpocapsae]
MTHSKNGLILFTPLDPFTRRRSQKTFGTPRDCFIDQVNQWDASKFSARVTQKQVFSLLLWWNQTKETSDAICGVGVMFLQSEPIIAASLILTSGVLGIVANGFVLYKVVVEKIFGRQFGKIWISRGIAYIIFCSLFAFYLAPVLVTFDDLLLSLWGKRVLHIMMFLCNVVLAHSFLIATNRCVLIALPLRYKSIFSSLNTGIHITLCWVVCLAFGIHEFIDPCHPSIVESDQPFVMGYPDCGLFENISQISVPTAIMLGTILVDLYAIHRIGLVLKIRDKLQHQPSYRKNSRKPRGREVKLCCMILAQVIFAIFIYAVVTGGNFIQNEFWNFMCTTFMWSVAQFVDAIIVIIFCREMNKGLVHRVSSTINSLTRSSKQSSTAASRPGTTNHSLDSREPTRKY